MDWTFRFARHLQPRYFISLKIELVKNYQITLTSVFESFNAGRWNFKHKFFVDEASRLVIAVSPSSLEKIINSPLTFYSVLAIRFGMPTLEILMNSSARLSFESRCSIENVHIYSF